MSVIIGVDPHKGSHTAVAIGGDEARLAKVRVRATRRQVDQLLAWAARFAQRTWAIESAGGLGYLLAQQLLNAGEQVLDVPATLAARVRVLGTGRSNKNDPNDAHSVAVAALCVEVGCSRIRRISRRRVGATGHGRHPALREAVPRGIPVGSVLADDPPQARRLPEGLRRFRPCEGRVLRGARHRATAHRRGHHP
jgi:Transposase